jgi:hypothetical protein
MRHIVLWRVIIRNFKHSTSEAFINMYKSLVRPHLEHANSVLSPFRQMYTVEIQKVQKRATKQVDNI